MHSVSKQRDSTLTRLQLHMKQTIMEGMEYGERESVHCLRLTFYFAVPFDEPGGKVAFEMRRSFLYIFLVGMHFRLFVHKFLPSLVYSVRIS